jgi:DNA-binding FrmR family transcriptional regulator
VSTPALLTPPRARHPGKRHDADILSLPRKGDRQLTGITSRNADHRYCIDILDQLAATRAAIDAVSLILLQDHINACLRDATTRREDHRARHRRPSIPAQPVR